MQEHPVDEAFHKQVIRGVRSLWDTFYWIDIALARHIREFKARQDVADAVLDDSGRPIEIIARLEHLHSEATKLSRDVDRSRLSESLRPWNKPTPYEALSKAEMASLNSLVKQLDVMGHRLAGIGEQLGMQAADMVAATDQPMSDYVMDFAVHCHLRPDDPGYTDGGDITIAETDDISDPSKLVKEWEGGSADFRLPMNHGGLAHWLHITGGFDRRRLDYLDLLRIGTVWADIVVRYQFEYDMVEQKWVKVREWDGDVMKTDYFLEPDSARVQTTEVREN